MAKESWLTVDPMSGTGNAELTNVGATHKGRIQRETVVTAVVRGIEAAKSYSVVQKPTSEYITLDDLTFDVGEEQAEISVSGKSNSPVINITNSPTSAFQSTFSGLIANGLATTIGQPIQGDPGATDEFAFSFTIIVPKNTIGARVGKVTVSGSTPEVSQIITLNQATSTYRVSYSKGDYVQSISKASEIVNYGGIATAVATLLPNDVQYTYSFDGWYEGQQKVSGDLSLSVENITSARTFVAVGQRTLNRYTLAFTITPEGGGTVQGGGTYDYGSEVSSTAVPLEGYTFTKWVDEQGVETTNNPVRWLISGNREIEAVFTIKSYNISTREQYRVAESGEFTSGTTGGTATGGGTFTHGSPVTLTASPSQGYGFDGWYEGTPQVKVSSDEAYTFNATKDRILVAKFQRSWFTIAYVAGTGGSVNPTSDRVEYGGSSSSTATPNTGYSFTGWSNGEESPTLTVSNVTANATYSASFGLNNYVVSYSAGLGIASVSPESEVVDHGSDAKGSTATLEVGYNFDGWYNGETKVSSELTYGPANVTSNMSFTAKGILKSFTITGNPMYRDTDSIGDFTAGDNGGTVTGSGVYNYGAKATLTASPKTGYTFAGWYDGDEQVSSSLEYVIESVTENVTLAARFQKNWFTVTYNVGTGVSSVQKTSERVPYNGSVTSDEAVALTGYNSPTWELSSGDATLSVKDGIATLTVIHSDCVLLASAAINQYQITYSKNSNIESIDKNEETVNYGGTATNEAVLKENTAQFTYSFDGWYEGSSKVSETLALSISNITSNRTFEARGNATVNQYTLTVVNGTGSGTYDYGTSVTIAPNEIEGKQFSKWSDGSTEASRQVVVVADATYTAEFVDKYYTVSYVAGTGVSSVDPTSESVKHGDNAVGSTATVSTGYTFDGWYNGDVRVSTSITYAPADVVSDITLTAKANINVYTVTPQPYYRDADNSGDFASGESGGTVSGGGNVNHGSSITVTASPATGYDFVGWFTTGVSGGDQLSTDASYQIDNVTASRNVYARFQKRWFTVNYVAGDYCSVSSSSERVAYGASGSGSTLTPFETTAEYSYAVDGWYNGETKVSSSADFAPTNVTSDLTYTAKATRTLRSYLVTYVAGDYISGVSPESETVNYGSNAGGSTATVQSDSPEWLYSFDGWYDEGGTKVSSSLTYGPEDVTGDRQIEARGTRTANTAEISVSMDSSSSSRGSVSGGGTYTIGSTATVTCSFNSGDVFDGWYEGGTRVSTDASYSFTVTGARSLVAKVLYLDVSPSSLNFGAGGGTQSFTISTNIDGWSIS